MTSNSKRPAPLSEDILEPGLLATGTMLLGRTRNVIPNAAIKKPLGEPSAIVRTPMLTPQNLWCYTPIATPSPTARFSRCFAALEQHRALPLTPGAQVRTLQAEATSRLAVVAAVPARPSQRLSLEEALMPQRPEPSCSEQQDEDDDSTDSEGGEENTPVVALADVPQPPLGAKHPSVGSEGHAVGVCKRCCFFPRGRCLNGYECLFCHEEHEKRKRKNKKKTGSKRMTGSGLAPRMSLMSAARPSFHPGQLMHPSSMAPQSLLMVPAPMQYRPPTAPMMQVMPPNGCYFVGGPQVGSVPMQQVHYPLGMPPGMALGPLSGSLCAMQQPPPPQHLAAQAQICGTRPMVSQVIMLEPAYSSHPIGHLEQPQFAGAPCGARRGSFADLPPPPMRSPRLGRQM